MKMSFFFQAEDGIRYLTVTGVQTCALPIFRPRSKDVPERGRDRDSPNQREREWFIRLGSCTGPTKHPPLESNESRGLEIGRASCRERVWMSRVDRSVRKSKGEGSGGRRGKR